MHDGHDWQPTTDHGKYLKFQLERQRQKDEMLTQLAQEEQERKFALMQRQLRIRPSPHVIQTFWQLGQVSDADYQKYMLSDDPDYCPPIKPAG